MIAMVFIWWSIYTIYHEILGNTIFYILVTFLIDVFIIHELVAIETYQLVTVVSINKFLGQR